MPGQAQRITITANQKAPNASFTAKANGGTKFLPEYGIQISRPTADWITYGPNGLSFTGTEFKFHVLESAGTWTFELWAELEADVSCRADAGSDIETSVRTTPMDLPENAA